MQNFSKNLVSKSPERSVKVFDSTTAVMEVKEVHEDKEDDTFCFHNQSFGSVISKNDSEILSVSLSEDSILSEFTMKSKRKSHIIKLRKKSIK